MLPADGGRTPPPDAPWSRPADEVLAQLNTTAAGLDASEARRRIE